MGGRRPYLLKMLSQINWITRRYRLNNFDGNAFEAGLTNWVSQKGFYVIALPKLDLFQWFFARAYAVQKSIWKTWFSSPTLYVGHKDDILYVFSTSKLAPELNPMFDQFVLPFVTGASGECIPETPIAFKTSLLSVSPLSYLLDKLKVDYSLHVNLKPEVEKVEAATEEVRVPPGVTVSVKRSRTIKHSVEIKDINTTEAGLEAGLKLPGIDVLKATIKTEVQSQLGHSWEESETSEYEVSLSGDKSPIYKLSWTDFMRVGTIEIRQNDQTRTFPFNCRESTTMEIIPLAAPQATAAP